jgi:hypothetical protein
MIIERFAFSFTLFSFYKFTEFFKYINIKLQTKFSYNLRCGFLFITPCSLVGDYHVSEECAGFICSVDDPEDGGRTLVLMLVHI